MIRVVLPQHLRTLANCGREVTVHVQGSATIGALLDALESKYPQLGGTIREYGTGQRRKLVRFYACEEDLSHEPMETPLPPKVLQGTEPFYVIGAIAGG